MKHKYPFKLFLIGVLFNFLITYRILLLAGLLFAFLGLWFKPGLKIGVALLLIDLIVSVVQQLILMRSLNSGENKEFDEIMDAACGPEGLAGVRKLVDEKIQESAFEEPQSDILEKLVVYRALKASVRDDMTLDQLIDTFIEMCEISVGDPDDVLFETGTYDFTGEDLFQFSLVRQFQFMDDNEYVQVHLIAYYRPTLKTAFAKKILWGDPSDPEFFHSVRRSLAYKLVKDAPIESIEVSVNET